MNNENDEALIKKLKDEVFDDFQFIYEGKAYFENTSARKQFDNDITDEKIRRLLPHLQSGAHVDQSYWSYKLNIPEEVLSAVVSVYRHSP